MIKLANTGKHRDTQSTVDILPWELYSLGHQNWIGILLLAPWFLQSQIHCQLNWNGRHLLTCRVQENDGDQLILELAKLLRCLNDPHL